MRRRWVKWVMILLVGVGLAGVLIGPVWYTAMRWMPTWVPDGVYTRLAQARAIPGFWSLYTVTVIRPVGWLSPGSIPQLMEPINRNPKQYYHAGISEGYLAVEAKVVEVLTGDVPGTNIVKLKLENGDDVEMVYDWENSFYMVPGKLEQGDNELCYQRAGNSGPIDGLVKSGQPVRVVWRDEQEFKVIAMLMSLVLEGSI